MKKDTSRRLFIQNSMLATFGVTLFSSALSANTLISNSGKLSNIASADTITDLRLSPLYGKHITVKGKIFDSTGSKALSNVLVEVWHLSPSLRKQKYKAKIKTNRFGEYHFITDLPKKEVARSPRIYFKISNDVKEYSTKLIINELGPDITGKHWEENNQLGENLFPKNEVLKDASIITFNISI